MSEHQRETTKHQSLFQTNTELAFPSESATSWLQEIDLSIHDLPYVDHVIQEAFLQWRTEGQALTLSGQALWAVTDYEGRWIEGDEALHSEPFCGLTGEIGRCLESGEQVWDHPDDPADRGSSWVTTVIPVFTRRDHALVCLLVCGIPARLLDEGTRDTVAAMALHYRSCLYKSFKFALVSDILKVQESTEREANRRSILFQIMQRMHDQIDVETVLTEVLDSLEVLYPTVRARLLMSQDHQSRNPRVEPLVFHPWGEDICVRSFMDGRLMMQDGSGEGMEGQTEIAIPLGGKQGVYGVLHLVMSRELREDLDLQLIGMVVDTAGNAFENAKLYEQSNLLIHELRLINELTQRLNQSLKLGDIYKFASEEMLDIFQADYCCFLQYNEERNVLEVMASNVSGLAPSFDAEYGFGGLVFHKKEPVILSDYSLNGKVPSKLMEITHSQSLIASPLTVNGKVMGAILLTHRSPHYFSYDNYRLLQTLSSHIGLSVSNALLHAELRRMANRDMLTDMYARHYLDKMIQQYQVSDFCGSLIVVDIDEFKQVNDTYGHQKGDDILRQVSDIVKSSIREEDVPARWGGEELAVYMPQLGVHQAVKVAEVIRSRVARETSPSVTISSGIAEWCWTDPQVSVDSLFYRADMALYRAKNSGRNQIQMENMNDM
ncbi:diguanylate cyclase [Paenibacillus sp. VMFN-D1]|uniref:sensor domain-containing diguanylate cyclase n=1 Tax=Paenibacillus sp. VMFN-D1 TaxID=2135608 RepID=UPI000E24AA2A|nr:diguanylate cyclase [Paenibacillus sp. VMFN-D1]RED39246.1 diguanylate cyclase (GGDEF)-like protein [Paenibacillus sp. VMFN-D1]